MIPTSRMFSRHGTTLLGLGLALASLPLGAGSARSDSAGAARERLPYRVTRWSTDDGLPQNRVSALQQTRDGYLWIGTWFGLARFDGTRFVVFDKHNTPELTDDSINALAEDSDGTLWIATADGLVSYHEHQFARWTTESGLPHRKVWRLSACPAGGVWLQAGDYVTCLRQGKYSPAWKVNTPAWDANLLSLQAAPDGWLHVLTVEAGLLISPAADELRTNFLAGPAGLSHLTSGWPGRLPGQMWVGTGDGVHRREAGRWSTVGSNELHSCAVDFLHEDHDGRLWVNARPGGLKRWDGEHWTAIHLGEPVKALSVTCLEEDREGSVWIGTEEGLVQLQNRRMRTFAKQDGLPDDHVWSVCEGTNGTIWLGTKHGLSRIQDDRVVPVNARQPRLDADDRCVWPVRNGGVWIAKPGLGLIEFQDDFAEPVSKRALSGGDITALYQDRSGHLWIGTEGGVTAWRDGRVVARHARDSGQPVANVRCILEDREGTLWFGQQGEGLTRLKDGHFRTLTERDGLSSNRVWALHEDADGTIWIARDLHDDLGTALTGVALELDVTRRQANDGLARRLGESAGKVRALAERMREVVWAVNPRCDTVSSLASFLEQQAAQFLHQANLRVRFDFPEDIPPLPLDANARHQLALGLREALTNVVRHAGATEAVVSLILERGALTVEVKDNGRGFCPAGQAARGEGLGSLHARLGRIGGRFECVSEPGRGTTARFRLPIEQRPPGKETMP